MSEDRFTPEERETIERIKKQARWIQRQVREAESALKRDEELIEQAMRELEHEDRERRAREGGDTEDLR